MTSLDPPGSTATAKLPFALELLSPLKPPFETRAWFTAPHPSLPLVASCGSDKSVRIYSLNSFTQLGQITGGHKRSIRACAWKPGLKGESTLATGSFDASVGVWRHDDERGEEGQGAEEVDLTYGDADGDKDNDEEEEEWRFALVLDGHDSEVKSVAWNAGGNLLATCSRDKSVWVWEEVGEDDFETVAVLQEHTADVKSVAWHPEEELLASASYDNDVRLWREDVDDWGCVGLLRGHTSTVWMVEWEGTRLPSPSPGLLSSAQNSDAQVAERWEEQRKEWMERREAAGPRLASCSDDKSVIIWRRLPRERKVTQQNSLSIIRTNSNAENWTQEAILPKVHDRAILAVAWSKKTGRMVSTGGDGRIVVYEEQWRCPEHAETEAKNDSSASKQEHEQEAMEDVTTASIKSSNPGASGEGGGESEGGGPRTQTKWVEIARIEEAHGVFEINHVAWARRADKHLGGASASTEGGGEEEEEEVIVSTGDDGVVNIWTLKPSQSHDT